jgi:hypothetical protein
VSVSGSGGNGSHEGVVVAVVAHIWGGGGGGQVPSPYN